MSGSAILIVGAGAMGGTIGAHLVRSGHEVVFVDRAAGGIWPCASGSQRSVL